MTDQIPNSNAERQRRWRAKQRSLRERYVTGAGIDPQLVADLLAEIKRRQTAASLPDPPPWADADATPRYVTAELEAFLEIAQKGKAYVALGRALSESDPTSAQMVRR